MLDPNLTPESPSPVGEALAPALAGAFRPVRPAGERAIGVDVEALYVRYRILMLSVACRKFGVPEADAEGLLQEVFLAFLQTGRPIDNVKGWLVAAICNASRHYWRSQGRSEALPEDYLEHSDPVSDSLPEKRAMEMTIQQALGYLQPRCRETLRLHYFEGRSAAEMAREMETTTRYAEKLIHNCLGRVREIYINITAVTR
ncbi:MAG TPA: sigma-70 family RNA polymerase sigma factor [Thermoanaerobaculia bacterium]|nr:sigma-70 family RNA polymerase sigma factor [Thermoanaerobaculia bacterium]